jgi:hypothetical protein
MVASCYISTRMIFITRQKLQSFHGIGLNILYKGNRTIQNFLTNLQGQMSTSFASPQTHQHTQKLTLHCLFLGEETKSKRFFMPHSLFCTSILV